MDKPLPNNKAIEIALIANIFLNNDIIADCIGSLKESDFYYKSHKIIYSKLLGLYKKSIPIDLLIFINSISEEILKSIGGITHLTEIIGSEVSAANYTEYIKTIKNLSIKREVIKSCNEAVTMAYREETDIRGVIDTLETKILNTSDINEEKTVNLEELMSTTINLIENGYKNGGQLLGTTTGYRLIDNAINGFVKGDLLIIAARPSMGKTALSMEMLNKLPPEKKGLIFEMEMPKGKLGIRMLAPRTYINPQNLSKGIIKDTDFNVILKEAGEIVFKNNVFINCRTRLSVAEIRAEAKKIKIQNGLDVVFIDHIGKVRPDNPKATKNDQIGQISEGFKNMAMDLDICCVVLSQLNREVEKRTDKHPIMSDLRDSGCIEQDADEILMLYRDDYYAEREGRISKRPGLLEVLVAKNRDGIVGAIKLYYNTNYQIISDRPILY